MRRKIALALTLFIAVLSFSSCKTNKLTPQSIKPSSTSTLKDNLTSYNIDAELDTESNQLKGTQDVIYINNENVNLNVIYFHIYPNAYKTEETTPAFSEDKSSAYKNGFKPGYININSVTSSSEKLVYSIEGTDSTLLCIKLKAPLKPKETTNISISFAIILPPIGDRLGYEDELYNFGNWYPIAAVYDETGWNLDPYYSIGDPFYSDTANYKVTITVPKDMTVAATGELNLKELPPAKKSFSFKQSSVRDFAFVASKKLKLSSEKFGNLELKSYYTEGNEEKNRFALKTAKSAVEIYNKAFGDYPYKTLSIVSTSFSTGMEYPGIVFINKDYYHPTADNFYLEVTIAHEIAHQWWYGIVGNDEVDEAWIDESLASYSEVLYYENTISEDYGDSYMQNDYARTYDNNKNDIDQNSIILQSLGNFKNNNDYALLVYYKGAIMQDTLRREVGDENYFKILNTCFERYKYKNITTENFMKIVEEITKKEWDIFFNTWLKNK